MKSLVVVYTRTGNTRTVGERLASALGADFDLVISRASRDGAFGFVRSTYEATFGLLTEIAHPARKVDDYDLVVVGSPTWNGRVSSPVRTYLQQNRNHLRSLAFFATSSGRGADRALLQMRQIAGQSPRATLHVLEGEIGTSRADELVRNFALRLQGALPRAA